MVETNYGTPAGAVMHFAMLQAPQGWLECDGSEVSIKEYYALYQAIGDINGKANCPDMFKLPDLRGEFIRSLDKNRGIDENRVLGSSQNGTAVIANFDNPATVCMHSKNGSYNANYGADKIETGYDSLGDVQSSYSLYHATINAQLAVKGYNHYFGITRPRNVALLACIKY